MRVMKAVPVLVVLALFLSNGVSQAATVYLKNGSKMSGVTSYTRLNGKVQLYIHGGFMEIPEEDILKIVETAPPAGKDSKGKKPVTEVQTKKPPAKKPPTPARVTPKAPARPDKKREKARLIDIGRRLAEIKTVEDRAESAKVDLDKVRLRIEVLFQKGRKRALKAGKPVSAWLSYLTQQERKWVQLNTMKKKILVKDKEEADEKLAPLLREKEGLLREREQLQREVQEY